MKLMAHSSHNNKIHCFTGNFFSPKPCCVNYLKLPLYNQVILVPRWLHVFCLCLQTVEHQSFPVLSSYTWLALPWKQKGSGLCNFRKLARYQHWNPCLCGPEDAEAMKHSKKMSKVFREDKTSTAFDLMLSPRTAGDLYQQKHHPSSMDN